MSHCEEREEEGTDKQHIHRPEPPSVSMKSDEPGPPHTKYVNPPVQYTQH